MAAAEAAHCQHHTSLCEELQAHRITVTSDSHCKAVLSDARTPNLDYHGELQSAWTASTVAGQMAPAWLMAKRMDRKGGENKKAEYAQCDDSNAGYYLGLGGRKQGARRMTLADGLMNCENEGRRDSETKMLAARAGCGM